MPHAAGNLRFHGIFELGKCLWRAHGAAGLEHEVADCRYAGVIDQAVGAAMRIRIHGDALLHSLDSFKAFVDLNTSPRIGLALAPYHLQAGGASVEEAIRICGRQLLFFYAWQDRPEVAQLPGHGPTDFRSWLRALAQVNYGGFVNVFMHGHLEPDVMSAALTKSRDYLKQCAKT